MRFNPRARIDTSGLEDRTGSPGRRGGGAGLRIGGLGGLVVLVVLIVAGVDPSILLDPGGSEEPSAQSGPSLAERCRTGADAQADEDCQLAAIVQSLNGFWADRFEQETGQRYRPARTVSFSGGVTTDGCGSAGSEVGPFYCPVDQRIYLDLSFFSEMLERDLGGQDAGFTRAYVVAHEYGHHVENLLGVLGQVRTQSGPGSDAVKVELMADCLAGVWAASATSTTDGSGEPLFAEITETDVADAVAAARTVGDDRIQRRTTGRVDPDRWTHGSSAEREQAFATGLRQGTISSCNLF